MTVVVRAALVALGALACLVCGLDPVDGLGPQEERAVRVPDQEPRAPLPFGVALVEQGQEPLLGDAAPILQQDGPRMGHRRPEPLPADGLEQVTEGVDVERLERALGSIGHVDQAARHMAPQPGAERESVNIGEGDVEKDEVGSRQGNDFDRRAPGVAFRNQRDVRLVLEELPEVPPGETVGVHHDAPESAPARWRG